MKKKKSQVRGPRGKVEVSGRWVFREGLSEVVTEEQRPERRGQAGAGARAVRYNPQHDTQKSALKT